MNNQIDLELAYINSDYYYAPTVQDWEAYEEWHRSCAIKEAYDHAFDMWVRDTPKMHRSQEVHRAISGMYERVAA